MALELLDQRTGTIRCWYNSEGGYGFILPDDGGEAVFVHHTCLAAHTKAKSLPEGTQVLYEVARRDMAGLWAKDVCMADQPSTELGDYWAGVLRGSGP